MLLVAQKDAKLDLPGKDAIYTTGKVAKVKQLLKMPQDTIRVLIEGINRAVIKNYVQTEPFFKVEIIEIIDDDEKTATAEEQALMRSITNLFEQYVELTGKLPPDIIISLESVTNPGRFADLVTSHLNVKIEDKQKIIEALPYKQRLETLFKIISKEVEILQIERRINSHVKKQIEKSQKEYYLREQMKAIRKELGEDDERTIEADEYRKKIDKLKINDELKEKMLIEVKRLEKMVPASAEVSVIRNYLDWLISLPWNKFTEDMLDIESAKNPG